ncbi:hypothetical protein GE118_02355 [Mycoplasma sp. NEAQ87857]|uniref:hypothetical protein n=1 Tax=Mycoplasma sp. NEAQ87857 TaxID=2683967 RepID=UPI001318F623|nr:hypothetical protein [Mycoplasma sp. NEAQ87857]QGZ97636.1 hypothetical protein GE118_02355 [Mycoplasma sp. NEAQ87857]
MKQNNSNNISLKEKEKFIKNKYFKSKSIFIILSILSISIASLTVVLNLFSIRYNEANNTIMTLFITIAIINVIGTFCVSIQSFFNITNKKNILNENIEQNQLTIKNIQENKDITEKDLENIIQTFE